MKITDINSFSGELIETDREEPPYTYVRYSPEGWGAIYGESEETVYDCEELEATYQAYKAHKQ